MNGRWGNHFLHFTFPALRTFGCYGTAEWPCEFEHEVAGGTLEVKSGNRE